MESLELGIEIVKILDSKKAEDIKLVDIKDQTIIADYFVIADGSSSTQVRALADEVEFILKQKGEVPSHVEGFESKSWILLDYGAVIVHIFYKETREFYGLERLWTDGKQIDISEYIKEN